MNSKSFPLSIAASNQAPLGDGAQPLSLEAALMTLKTGDFQSRWDAAKRLPNFGETAIAPLIELLQEVATEEEDWELCWFNARILGEFKHPATIDSLVHLLQSTQDSEIAAVVATAFSQLGPSAIAPLTDLLAQPATRQTAIAALAQIHHAEVVPVLLEVVNDDLPEIRATAIAALSHFQSPSVRPRLLAALKDPQAKVRQVAVIGVGCQANQYDAVILLHALEPLLWDLNLEICSQTAIALGKLGTHEAISLLSRVLQSDQTPERLQLEVIRVLARIGNTSALDSLQQFLDRSLHDFHMLGTSQDSLQVNLVQEVITVLGRLETSAAQLQAVQILLNLLHKDHPIAQTSRGKQQIALSLGQLGHAEAIEALVQLLADTEMSVRFHALAALKQLAPQGSYQRLRWMATNSTEAVFQAGIATALQEWHVHDLEPT